MTKSLVTLLLILITFDPNVLGQNCIHTKLSKKFDFKTEIQRIKIVGGYNDSCIITITIIDKFKKTEVQKITYSSTHLFKEVFLDCGFERSYITYQNIKSKDVDNDFGDLIVADFNFDDKEDFAIKGDAGGNGGPAYNFYIQKNGKFILDSFLTEQMMFFPTNINKHNKTLTTLVHANVYERGETTYKLDSEMNKWKKVRHRFVAYYTQRLK